MKKNLLSILFVIMSLVSYSQNNAQDKIIKKSGEVIECKIRTVGQDYIRYYLEGRPELDIEIDLYKVQKIIFSDGKEMDIAKNNFEDKDNYGTDSKNGFKVDFLSPLYGYTEFAYQRSIKPGQSIELALGIIGWGKDLANENPKGAFVKLGYRFMVTPDYNVTKMKYSHVLNGRYIMPELAYRNHSIDVGSGKRTDIDSFAFMIKVGKQSVFTNTFLIDWYFGGGYGYSDNHDEYSGHYGFITGTDSFPLSFTAGIRIGFLM